MINQRLLNQVRAWQAQDPDSETFNELEALVQAGNETELEARFASRLEFGTAGLRGEIAAGPSRMNRVVVGQAAIGLSNFLNQKFESPSLVIGFDGRKNSQIFAFDSARLASALGIKVWLFQGVVPTPVLAFAVKHLGASAGVMVTASHNPPNDNGYKVYLGGENGGSQIISPTDAQIHEQIVAVANSVNIKQAPVSDEFEYIGAALIEAYEESVVALGVAAKSEIKIAYTAMHGVGHSVAASLFSKLGFRDVHSVAAQQEPDAKFPTVAFPNPEEPGAMDMVSELAEQNACDLVIANDPDADRLCVEVRQKGKLRRLTGDETGLLLGEWAAMRSGGVGTLANSMVSAEVLGKVAEHYGLGFQQTKTGFKWISKVPELIFGYEEALGYCVDPNVVPDKDGISAAMVIAAMASERNLGDWLDELCDRYGHYATGQVSIRFESVAQAKAAFAKVADGSNSDMVYWRPEPAARVIFRVSGTEPKLKCYMQFVGETKETALAGLSELRAAVKQRLKD